jgi:hypothetical protein
MPKPPTPAADFRSAQTCIVCGVNIAPDGLAGIYRGISADIPCPAAAFWCGR